MTLPSACTSTSATVEGGGRLGRSSPRLPARLPVSASRDLRPGSAPGAESGVTLAAVAWAAARLWLRLAGGSALGLPVRQARGTPGRCHAAMKLLAAAAAAARRWPGRQVSAGPDGGADPARGSRARDAASSPCTVCWEGPLSPVTSAGQCPRLEPPSQRPPASRRWSRRARWAALPRGQWPGGSWSGASELRSPESGTLVRSRDPPPGAARPPAAGVAEPQPLRPPLGSHQALWGVRCVSEDSGTIAEPPDRRRVSSYLWARGLPRGTA